MEQITGEKITYPEPWLNSYTVQELQKLDMKHEILEGVEIKDLAYFFHRPNLKLISTEKNVFYQKTLQKVMLLYSSLNALEFSDETLIVYHILFFKK